jgi:gamma-glutamyltranspeptidase/glutathione hydrolase
MFRLAFGRPPAVASDAIVATSHPAAVRAGLRAFERGGNAADAAVAAAAMLSIAEPFNCGPGGDLVALVWMNGDTTVLDAMGPAPAEADPAAPLELRGPRSVTVPGAPAGWAALAERFGRLGLGDCLRDAVDAADEGIALSARVASLWSAEDPCPPELGPLAPRTGDKLRFPELGATLRLLANKGPDVIYRGELAPPIARACWLSEDDLAGFEPRWTAPLVVDYRGLHVYEAPPPTQGVAALEALKLLESVDPSLQNQVRSVALALQDAHDHVRDGADVSHLLDRAFVARRVRETPGPVAGMEAGTAFVCAVDRDRMAVSLIQSLFGTFGSGVVVPGTGIVLQNRAAWFAVSGHVEPGRRPYHTIIPALASRGGELAAAFGLVGGLMQAQGHVQLVSGLVDDGLDPQEVLDRARFRVEGDHVSLERGLWDRESELGGLGLEIVRDTDWVKFGAGQVIIVEDGALLGGSDPRMDGYAAGF